MDTCPEYIKQCEKAEEIQSSWKPQAWDYVFCQEEDEVVVLSEYETDGGFYGHQYKEQVLNLPARISGCSNGWKEGHIWLPRQDQLIEMLHRPQDVRLILTSLGIIKRNLTGDTLDNISSMEQVWLLFVMWYKYCKRREGKEWIPYSENI